MKAWIDIENDPNKTIGEDSKTYWYIDMGVKIEKNKQTGEIVIKNTMNFNEYFLDITLDQYDVFENQGWLKGCLKVNIDHNNDMAEKYEYKMNRVVDEALISSLKKLAEKNRIKSKNYSDRLNKLV